MSFLAKMRICFLLLIQFPSSSRAWPRRSSLRWIKAGVTGSSVLRMPACRPWRSAWTALTSAWKLVASWILKYSDHIAKLWGADWTRWFLLCQERRLWMYHQFPCHHIRPGSLRPKPNVNPSCPLFVCLVQKAAIHTLRLRSWFWTRWISMKSQVLSLLCIYSCGNDSIVPSVGLVDFLQCKVSIRPKK